MLSDLIREHMTNPRNRGVMDAPDGVGRVVGPLCGDEVTFYIKVKDGIISDATFTTYGCWAVIGISSIITERVRGQSLEHATEIEGNHLGLGELPDDKNICLELAISALRKAIQDSGNL